MNIFGFTIKPSSAPEEKVASVVTPTNTDGSLVVNSGVFGEAYGVAFDIDGQIKNEVELINRYRTLAAYPEVSEAVEDIVNEAISINPDEPVCEISVDSLPVPPAIKKKITEAFDEVLTLLEFNNRGHEIFERWYVDGKVYYQILLDVDKPKNGIQELREIDPRKIKKIKNIKKKRLPNGVEVIDEVEEYFLFNDQGITNTTTAGIRLSPDSVAMATSGIIDQTNGLILSNLHKAIKPANQLKMLEDAVVIYRIVRAPERRVFYVDVGGLPKGKAEQYVTDIMNKFKNKLVYDAHTGEVADAKKHQCLTMDTRVPLLDGRTLTLSEIADEMSRTDKQLWAYSCDPITGEFAPGKITWAGVSRPNAQVMRLTLDNGESITCTPDHKFPVWNKGMVNAEDLTVGESLIPHYTRLADITSNSTKLANGDKGYQQIFENNTGKWRFTHRAVSSWKDSVGLPNEFVFREEFEKQGLYTIHHINIDRFDNTPENLVRMNSKDHIAWHRHAGSNSGKVGGRNCALRGAGCHNKNHPDYKKWRSDAGKAAGVVNSISGVSSFNRAKGREVLAELIRDPEWLDWFGSQISESWTDEKRQAAAERAKRTNLSEMGNVVKSAAFKDKNSEISLKHKQRYSTEYPESAILLIKEEAKNGQTLKQIVDVLNNTHSIVEEFQTINAFKVLGKQKSYSEFNVHDVRRMFISEGYDSFKHLVDSVSHRNHKIAKIEWLDERMDTGCLTIDGKEEYHTFHTFALEAGVYTGNSMMEDFWMPRRDGGKGTEITTLPGGQGLGQLDDLDYFKDKLYHSLNVPVSRMKPDTSFSLGRSNEVSRDEIKFAKFIDKQQSKFSRLLLEALRVQLISKGIINSSDWESFNQKIRIKFARDNYFSELKEVEILNNRAQAASQMDALVGKYYSREWIQRKILRLSDAEIKEIEKQNSEDKKSNPEMFGIEPEQQNVEPSPEGNNDDQNS